MIFCLAHAHGYTAARGGKHKPIEGPFKSQAEIQKESTAPTPPKYARGFPHLLHTELFKAGRDNIPRGWRTLQAGPGGMPYIRPWPSQGNVNQEKRHPLLDFERKSCNAMLAEKKGGKRPVGRRTLKQL